MAPRGRSAERAAWRVAGDHDSVTALSAALLCSQCGQGRHRIDGPALTTVAVPDHGAIIGAVWSSAPQRTTRAAACSSHHAWGKAELCLRPGPVRAHSSSVFLFRLLLYSRFAARRVGPLAIVLTTYDLWRRLPRRQRQKLAAHGRRQGSRLATSAYAHIAAAIRRAP